MLSNAYEVYDNVLDFTNAGVDDEGELVTTFADTMRVLQFQEVTIMKV